MPTRQELGTRLMNELDSLFSATRFGGTYVGIVTVDEKLKEIRILGKEYLALAPENRATFERDFLEAELAVAEARIRKAGLTAGLSKVPEDLYRSTGGGLMRRLGPDHLITSRNERVPEMTTVTDNFLGIFPVTVPTGQTFHRRVVEHYDSRGRKTGMDIYDRDCFGRKIR